MATQPARRRTPEELELEKKKTELSALESELSQCELELATFQAELHAFERRYLRIVGVRYAELDEIEAQIAELLARQRPKDDQARCQAGEARAKADESAQAVGASKDARPATDFKPSDELKKLYREIAKCVHPDLTTDEKERARRHAIMSEANRAYEEGDESQLRAILEEWESSPDTVQGEGIAAELVRIIRKVHQVTKRLSEIAVNLVDLRRSEIYQMKKEVEEAAAQGRDLLREMSDRLEAELKDGRMRLSELTRGAARL